MSLVRPRGLALRLWIAMLSAVTLGLLAGPSAAIARAQDPASECLADGGIYVYVFDQGTELVAGCTHAQTGMARLLELTTVQTAGQGFICQIAGRPDRCVADPAGDQPYWNYWWWRDSEWVYANIGGGYRGVPGSIEAWHYSVGEPPPTRPGDPQPSTVAAAEPVESSPSAADDGGLPSWVPTAVTALVIVGAVAGYALSRRKPRGG